MRSSPLCCARRSERGGFNFSRRCTLLDNFVDFVSFIRRQVTFDIRSLIGTDVATVHIPHRGRRTMMALRVCCLFVAVLVHSVPLLSMTALAEEHYFLFTGCMLFSSVKRVTVKPGDTVTMRCPGATSTTPNGVTTYTCQGPDPECTDGTRVTYPTLFPKAPSDFQFWSGGDTLSTTGTLHIPPEADDATFSYRWDAPSGGMKEHTRLVIRVRQPPKEERAAPNVPHSAHSSFMPMISAAFGALGAGVAITQTI
ncbi:SAG-related sequence SRS25 [Besnoitia besnoiti]|uniref:SAG-related sequence SRS25 n=1 Tax=Besnoitia besnoiti TaxID=94643 RepID=A0A2A9MDD1_BESBE|nr:SAG-related sequence SRS25 [Besnoitia besnoiti]PFH36508.1 SAG-related sequence SRS25 [Besnoitia besnoiti]